MAREYLVTGATGLIASHLVKTLLHRGHFVRATVRDLGRVSEGPIVKGTCNILNSCAKSATLKRVVLTSSIFAINHQPDDSRPIYNESHWTDLEYCKRNNMWYAYAKTVAEQTAWKRAKECGLDLVAVLPTLVVGPVLNRQPSSTAKYILDLIKGALGGYKDKYMFFVHVEDVAAVHILAMENPAAQGRLICSNGTIKRWAEVIGTLRKKYPMYPFETKAIKDNRDQHVYKLDTSKVMQLGFPGFKSIREIFDDCIKSFQEKGLL